jgi:hypothetical protein
MASRPWVTCTSVFLKGHVLQISVAVSALSLEFPYGLEPLVPQNLYPREANVKREPELYD